METNHNLPGNITREPVTNGKKHYDIENRIKNGANWFYWIAGLSLVNTLILLFGGEWNFIAGLGITQLIDGLAWGIAEEVGNNSVQFFALVLDLMVLGLFVALGYFARQKKGWSFVAGIVLYAFDTLLFLLAMDIIGIGFHALALFFIYGGYRALKEFQLAHPAAPSTVTPVMQQQDQFLPKP